MWISNRVIRAIAVVLVVPVLVLITGEIVAHWFIVLGEEKGWYEHPSRNVDAIMMWISVIVASPWFHRIGGGIIGFALGVWVFGMRTVKGKELGTSGTTAQIAKTSDILATKAPVLLRLQFHVDKATPTEIRSENVLSWYVVWSGEMATEFSGADGKPMGGFRIPKSWTIFMIFDKPSIFRQLIVEPAMQDFPRYEVKQASVTMPSLSLREIFHPEYWIFTPRTREGPGGRGNNCPKRAENRER
jgi:hypothetical protein